MYSTQESGSRDLNLGVGIYDIHCIDKLFDLIANNHFLSSNVFLIVDYARKKYVS